MSVLNNINLEETQTKLYNKLKPSGWGDRLRSFINSSDFENILAQLLKEAQAGNRFTPPLRQVFRAFEECPYNKLKVVMIGQDPYPYINCADGIAFSGSNLNRVETSLKFMFKELEDTVYPLEGYEWNPDLARWCNQGVLLINSAFTTTIGKVGQHYKLWQPFMAFLLDTLATQNSGLIYVFMGKKAQEWCDFVPDNNFKLICSHPASAAHSQLEKWDSGNIFNKVSDLVKKHYNETIIW